MVEVLKWFDTFTEKELIRGVFQGSHRIIHDRIEVKFLARILKKNCWITGTFCKNLIERIQLELGMHYLDRERLYFVESDCC